MSDRTTRRAAWRQWLKALVLAAGAALGGCASTPATTVVLLPDEDGHVGAVVVSDPAGGQRLSQAYGAVTVARAGQKPSDVAPRGEASVTRSYGDLLRAQPRKPISFTLYFLLGSTALTDESKSMVPEVIQSARSRKPTEIAVYGHADASGTERRNDKLSEERARLVADMLRKSDPAFDEIDVQSFGDRVPAVPTEGRVPEPRNRRAEVVIL